VRPGAAAVVLACVAAAALLADRLATLALLVAGLLVVCARAPARRRRPYLVGGLTSALGVLVLSPLLWSSGEGTLLWVGPTVPVLGQLDVSTVELHEAATNALRLAAVALAFSAYALLLDHDQLVAAARGARRSALAVALATRLLPTLERDAVGMAEAVRGRGVALEGIRGYATLLSPLVSGSLERASSLAEAMEARGFGRPGGTRAPRPSWRTRDRVAVALGGALVLAAVVWL
jgi:energy-coupling factor transport system permease protein